MSVIRRDNSILIFSVQEWVICFVFKNDTLEEEYINMMNTEILVIILICFYYSKVVFFLHTKKC